ncbi:MAG: flagellar basal body L-ring protein FlgH, partial [Bdellovibrionales bacterium]|nr:flagellar basal body L-ring protein FlgH [Bdellovibrionales bacterium]
QIISLFVILVTTSGCANFGKKFKAFLNGKPAPQETAPMSMKAQSYQQSFNNTPKMHSGPVRNYKRMTKEKLKQESNLTDHEGSLWVMEGQGAYLFSQNIIRMIGDSISVRIVGDPKQQLESKVGVIKKLLDRLKEAQLRRNRRVAAETEKKDTAKNAKPKVKKPATPKGPTEPNNVEENKFAVRSVPTRIVERLVDGNYRIKGSQPFLIGNREYKAIVTGVVRAEDFSEDGIDASKLIDSKFDIVSVRKRSSSL